MLFRYAVYVAATKRTQSDTIEAASEAEAEQELWRRFPGGVIVSLEAAAAPAQPAAPAADNEVTLDTLLPTFFGVKPAQITLFTRHLAALMAAGISLPAAVGILHQQADGAFRRALGGVLRDVRSGLPLSQAVAQQDKAFPPFYPRMVRVGETSGNLEVVLRQMALYLEKEQAVKSRVRSALAYPTFVFLMSIFVVIIILTFALPALTSLYGQFKAELPLPTRLLIAIIGFARASGPLLLVLLLFAILVVVLAAQTPEGRQALDNMLLRLPLMGSITVRSILARYTRTLSLLLRAGLPLVDIMDLVEATVGNVVARQALAAVRSGVLRGQTLSEAMAGQSLFPTMLAQMVRVGEETGNLAANLEAVADLYEDETDRAISAMTGVLEPALTIGMGLVVAFIALSTILPIYGIMRQIR